MLALIKDGNFLSEVLEGSRLVLPENIIVMPAIRGWQFADYSLHDIQPAKLPEPGMRVVSSSVKFIDGVWKSVSVYEAIPPLTHEEMPHLSMVDFRRKLRAIKVIQRYNEAGNPIGDPDGIYEEDILGVIGLIADKELQAEARDYFLYAQYISRANVWVDILGGMFGLTPQQIDILWMSDVNSENIEFI